MDEVEISLNGHTFELDRSVPQLGDYIGEAGNLPPRIRKIEVTNKTLSEISVKVTSARAEGAAYKYSIKKLAEDEEAYVEKEPNGGETYTFTGLISPEKYTIKVDLVIDGEIKDTKTENVMLGELEEGTITFEGPIWPGNGTASAIVKTNTSYQLQYQINAIEDNGWQNISNGGTVTNIPAKESNLYARLWDGTNASDYATFPISDTVEPKITEIKEIEVTETTIKVQVIATDNESGIAKIEYSSNDGEEYTIGETETATEYTFTGLTELTEYTIKVRVTDGAGNTAELSKKIATDGEKFSDIYETTTEYTDSEGNTAWIPGGFAVGVTNSINKINGGLVITDKIDENHKSIGNEFVWVPIEDYTTMYEEVTEPIKLYGMETTTSVYSKFGIASGEVGHYRIGKPGDLYSVREPDISINDGYYYNVLGYDSLKDMADKMVEEYMATYESIKKYEGFYIGRYELTGTVEKPTVQKGKVLEEDWYNLKKACTNIVSTNYAQTTMIYGNQWDTVCNWLYTKGYDTYTCSNSWGNYFNSTGAADIEGKGLRQITGFSKAWSAQNIYDLAGNYSEYTQEANYGQRSARSGHCQTSNNGSYNPVMSRNTTNPTINNGYVTSRPALYLLTKIV